MVNPVPRSSIRPFIKARSGGNIDTEVDKVLTELNDNVANSLNSITDKASLDNLTYTGIAITSGTVLNFNHKLGRAPVGWHLIGKSGFGDVCDQQATNKTPTSTLKLLSNANLTISILVF